MKNNLLNLKSFKSANIDARLPNHNDFLELVIMDKIEEEEFPDITDQIMTILTDYDEDEIDVDYEEEEDGDECSDPSEDYDYSEVIERLKAELREESERSNRFLQAGYANCMEEAIRFLVEEENISPEHPIVKNLKAHLEKSRDRILERGRTTTGEPDFCSSSRFVGNSVQNCRDFG